MTTRTRQRALPTGLKHQTLCAIPYVAHDGKWAGNTDAQHLSLGRAQWNSTDLSAKVLRHTETRWSRQSEELPVHRAIDLVLFLAWALFGKSDEFPAHTLEHQQHPLKIEPSRSPSLRSLEREYPEDVHRTRERLRKLREVLNDLHQNGAI